MLRDHLAQQNPTSYVIGTDLSKIQPETGLPNVEFIKDDAEEEWLHPNVPSFDYIHLRFVATGFDDPKKVMSQGVSILSPGGWIEYLDVLPDVISEDGSHEGMFIYQYKL